MWSKLKPLLLPGYFAAWIVYFAYFWSGLVTFDSAGNLMMGHVNVWGDWAAHFTMGSAMGYRDLFLSTSPFLIGERFSYPFVTNLISGLLIRLGMPFWSAFIVPSFLFSCGLVGALFYFFKTLFTSQKVAVIASLIFLLNGGLGFLYFASDINSSPQPWQTFLNPPHEYTRIDEEGIKWLSVIDSMVIPQRAFVLGFPLALLSLTLIYSYFFTENKKGPLAKSKLIVAAILLGLMPIIHTHSFLASGIILSFWLIADLLHRKSTWRKRIVPWIFLGLGIVSLAAPLYSYFFMDQVKSFIHWAPGWLAPEYKTNWLVFWLKNWSITPLLGVIGYYLYWRCNKKSLTKLLVFLPFLLLFVLANLWLFQPFAWDNTKLIVWSSVGISGLVSWLLVHKFTTFINKSLVILLFGVVIASGTIDAYRILRFDLHRYQMYSAEELALADWVRNETDPNAVWLTGTQHNHWLFNLTGRQAVMTYPGWLWTHGYEYTGIEQAVRSMYQRPNDLEHFQKFAVTYVVVGPQEIKELLANETAFVQNLTLIKETANYRVYQVPYKPVAKSTE